MDSVAALAWLERGPGRRNYGAPAAFGHYSRAVSRPPKLIQDALLVSDAGGGWFLRQNRSGHGLHAGRGFGQRAGADRAIAALKLVLEKRKKGKQMIFIAPADWSARLLKLETEAGA